MKFPGSTFLRSRLGIAAIAALLLILFLFRPVVGELRTRIATSIGSALGRRVTIDNVRLRLLPQPGFDLEGLVIYDDPAFSAEPMIRAQEVSAAIRIRSLFRGRLEIATLSASEPSINLVRNNESRWNLTNLLERNAQIPAAPTGKAPRERRPAFPYLEASNARVNFKIGQTKKSYALMDADVALWQDSENSWGARIKAEPVRTDFNLTDTGLLQINATWQRASSLWLTPVEIAVQWQKGQLGQITTLLSGKDRGWRGGVNFTAKLSGTPGALRIESQTAIEDFHRYDIAGSGSMRLTTVCSGQYDALTSTLADLLCQSPVGSGALRLHGNVVLIAQPLTYDLTLEAEKVPLSSVVRLLHLAKKQVPRDLEASGLLNAEFHATRNVSGNAPRSVSDYLEQWTGTGSATDVRLTSQLSPGPSSNNGNAARDELVFGTIPLTLVAADSSETSESSRRGHPMTKERARDPEPAQPHLRIGPVALAINGSAPVNAGGWLSGLGYRFFLRGDLELKDLFRVDDILGLPAARPSAEGSTKLDMNVSGVWQEFAPAVTAGTAQLRNVRAGMRGLNAPIEIASATLVLTPDAVKMEKIIASTGSTHWSGEVTAPRYCSTPVPTAVVAANFITNYASTAGPEVAPGTAPNCVSQFDLTADQLSSEDLAEWFTAHPAKRPWYRILNSNSNSNANDSGPRTGSPLLAIQAHGDLHVGRFALKKLSARQVATHVDVDRGKITLTALRAQLLQGTHQGNWIIDISGHDVSGHDVSAHDVSGHDLSGHDALRPDTSTSVTRDLSPQTLQYHGNGVLQDISLEQLGTLMNDAWITGTADGNFELDGSGNNFSELSARSDGRLRFVMRNGSLPHVEIGQAGPLSVHRFAGELRLKHGSWELSSGKLESRDGVFQVSGTASQNQGFDFVLKRGDEQSWTLTGTIAKPHIVAVDREESNRAEADAKTVKTSGH